MTQDEARPLVERLRERRTVSLSWPDAFLVAIHQEHQLALKAASALEARDREIATLREALEEIATGLDKAGLKSDFPADTALQALEASHE